VSIHQTQVALLVSGGGGGGGTQRFQGRSYPFKLDGLGIGGIGFSRLDATGTVYKLTRLEDFNGVYGEVRTPLLPDVDIDGGLLRLQAQP
jgi:hypothetical protein